MSHHPIGGRRSASFIGPGMLYAWMWSIFWGPIATDYFYYSAASFAAIFLAWRVSKLVTYALIAHMQIAGTKAFVYTLGLVGGLGTLLLPLVTALPLGTLSTTILLCFLAFLFASSEACLLVLWNSLYSEFPYDSIMRNAALFIGFGAVAFLLTVFLPAALRVAVTCLMPAASALLLAKEQGVHDLSYNADICTLGDKAAAEGYRIPRSLIVGSIAMACANGYIRGAGLSLVQAGEVSYSTVLFILIVAASFALFACNSLKLIYSASFLILGAGLLLQSFVDGLGASFIGLGFIVFEVSIWVLIAAISKKHEIDPRTACGKVWLVLEIGLLLGTLLGFFISVIGHQLHEPKIEQGFYLALAFLILALSCLVSSKPYLSIISDEIEFAQSESVYQQKMKKAAEMYALTNREKEVLELIAYGRDVAYIEKALVISNNTVKTHFRHIYSKFGVTNKQQLLDRINDQNL